MHAAIRQGDLSRMKAALRGGADANSVDADKTPALMNAAMYGSAAAVRLLLARGADPNARNATGATALIWAAGDAVKARMLVEAGADVNAQSGPGRTPLMVAASVAGNSATVRLLLDKGAKVDVRDRIDPMPVLFSGGGKGTALIEACRTGDLATVEMLLEAGADVNATDAKNGTALGDAIVYGRTEVVKALLARKASVDLAVSSSRVPALSLAAIRNNVEVARMLLKAGAAVNGVDAAGVTPLMWAAAGEAGNAPMVKLLLDSGADAKARNKAGESALDWAMARGETVVTRMLSAAGAPHRTRAPRPAAPEASGEVPLEKTIAALLTSGDASFKKTGCASCHHHTLPLVAAARAKAHGVAVNDQAVATLLKQVEAMLKPAVPILLEATDVFPDLPVTGSYILEALAAQQVPANAVTAALVHNISLKQMADGRWVGWSPRPPLEGGDIQATAMAVRALTLYPLAGRSQEMKARVSKARQFLESAVPATTEERVMRMLGLAWSGAPAGAVRTAARELAAMQDAAGGWSQLPALPADAYATGKALYAFGEVARVLPSVKVDSQVYSRGAGFLTRTRHADGSWHVTTRAYPFQPLIDTGYPHGRDQWISAAASSWAAIALLDAPVPTQAKQAKRPTGRLSPGD
jgi:ankyrin repeat protein